MANDSKNAKKRMTDRYVNCDYYTLLQQWNGTPIWHISSSSLTQKMWSAKQGLFQADAKMLNTKPKILKKKIKIKKIKKKLH